jgi:hypothetical protein
VSHDLGLVEELCDRALWLDAGRLVQSGHPRQVVDAYREAIAEAEAREHKEAKDAAEVAVPLVDLEQPPTDQETLRWGSGAAEITGARLLDADGRETYHLHSGGEARFVVDVRAQAPLDDFVFGIAIATPRGIECWGTNTELAGLAPRRFDGAATVVVHCPELRLAPGEYLVDLAIHARDGAPYDYRRRMFAFTVTAQERGVGIYFPRHRWSFEGSIEWDDQET